MKITFDVTQDVRRFVAVAGISLAFIVAQTAPALAATNSDRDGLSNSIEKKITKTSPFDKDTDNDRIKDGSEDKDKDGVDNTNELKLRLALNDDDSDDDGVEDGDEDDEDEDDDCDGIEDEYEEEFEQEEGETEHEIEHEVGA